MNENKTFPQKVTLFCASVSLLAVSFSVFAESAGKVVSTVGQVQAIDAAGNARTLQRDDAVAVGDTLATEEGRAQVQFADGGLVFLQPRTRFKIDEYHYAGAEDGSERSFFSLLKGGFRALTGTIGHANRQSYRVTTTVATIGIRGTAFNGRLCADDCPPGMANGLHTDTDEGTTFVFNKAGSVDVPAGKGAYVKDENTPPQLTEEDGDISGSLGNNPLNDPYYRAGEQPFDFTLPPSTSPPTEVLEPPSPPPPPPPPPTTGPTVP